jgi:hypothetical protein
MTLEGSRGRGCGCPSVGRESAIRIRSRTLSTLFLLRKAPSLADEVVAVDIHGIGARRACEDDRVSSKNDFISMPGFSRRAALSRTRRPDRIRHEPGWFGFGRPLNKADRFQLVISKFSRCVMGD